MDISLGPGPLGLLVVLVLLTAVSARLLGIRLRWWRTLVAGFPGLVAGILFIWAQAADPATSSGPARRAGGDHAYRGVA
jgi:hypothetical protein